MHPTANVVILEYYVILEDREVSHVAETLDCLHLGHFAGGILSKALAGDKRFAT